MALLITNKCTNCDMCLPECPNEDVYKRQALYLTCHQGAGPRDGLMVGLCQRFHLKVGIVRTSLEVSVCVLGYILGGTVGIGTVVFAAAIGWIVQLCLNSIARLPHFPYEGDNLH